MNRKTEISGGWFDNMTDSRLRERRWCSLIKYFDIFAGIGGFRSGLDKSRLNKFRLGI